MWLTGPRSGRLAPATSTLRISHSRTRNPDATPDHDDPKEHRLPNGLSRSLGSDVLVNLRPPRLVLVREPDLLRVERADQPLAFGARLVELGEEDRHVAADDD